MRVSPLAGQTIGYPDGFVIAEWSDPGYGEGKPYFIAPPHVHHEEDEAWYVLEGELCVRVGSEVHRIGSGGAVVAPKGKPHTYWNPNPGPARYLLVMGPKTNRLIQEIHAASDRSPEKIKEIFEENGCSLVDEVWEI